MSTTPLPNPNLLGSILSMIVAAEPAVLQLVHDLLVGSGGKSDQEVLTQDLADWDAIAAKAKAQLTTPATPPTGG